jgi:hypothetical protein
MHRNLYSTVSKYAGTNSCNDVTVDNRGYAYVGFLFTQNNSYNNILKFSHFFYYNYNMSI